MTVFYIVDNSRSVLDVVRDISTVNHEEALNRMMALYQSGYDAWIEQTDCALNPRFYRE